MSRLKQLLVLICATPLLLPPAWCCLPHACAKSAVVVKVRETCCQCKKCKQPRPTEPTPAAPKPNRCECLDRDAKAPETPERPIDPELVALLPVVESTSLAFGQDESNANYAHRVRTQSLQILNCSWRC